MRGHVQRKDKNWYVVLEMDREDGERKQKWISVRKELGLAKRATRPQADTLLIKKLGELQEGSYFEPAEMTVGEFLNKWMEDYARANLKTKTVEFYGNLITCHIIPELGKIELSKLRPSHIQGLLSQKLKGSRADDKEGGLSKRSVRYIYVTLHLALKHAVEWELASKNAAEKVKPPKVDKPKIQYWAKQETQKFLNATKGHRLYALYLLALTTGMRKGEILGLTWDNINFKKQTVKITQTLISTNDGDRIQDTAKTQGSERTLTISPAVALELSHHHTRQKEEFMLLGRPEKDLGLVFTSNAGTPLITRNLNRNFNCLIKKAKVRKIPFHSLRHTYATLMLSEYGEDIVTLSKRLGHSNVTTTLNTYGHVIPQKQKEAAARTDDLIAK